ncbi:hypothetical protein CXB51_033263 [Gossypium anomalum]|uniref:Uncharacterized protein n=1 Tax=Gossypium anomalum TaxID=47600 RepID=A0A8J6CMK7_9ROSI|nr:hypothetical protein CXB51_033263 [Gossypium anomalum]
MTLFSQRSSTFSSIWISNDQTPPAALSHRCFFFFCQYNYLIKYIYLKAKTKGKVLIHPFLGFLASFCLIPNSLILYFSSSPRHLHSFTFYLSPKKLISIVN